MTDLADITIEINAKVGDLGDVYKLINTAKEIQGPLRQATENTKDLANYSRSIAGNITGKIREIEKLVGFLSRVEEIEIEQRKSFASLSKDMSAGLRGRVLDILTATNQTKTSIAGLSSEFEDFFRLMKDNKVSVNNFTSALGYNDKMFTALASSSEKSTRTLNKFKSELSGLTGSDRDIRFAQMSRDLEVMPVKFESARKSAATFVSTLNVMDKLGFMDGDKALFSKEALGNARAELNRIEQIIVKMNTDIADFRKSTSNMVDQTAVNKLQRDLRPRVVFDIETAFKPRDDGSQVNRILQIFAQRVVGGQDAQSMNVYVKRNVEDLRDFLGGLRKFMGEDDDSTPLTSGAKKMGEAVLQGGPDTFDEMKAINKFINFIKGMKEATGELVLVGHNIDKFDISKMKEAASFYVGRGISKEDYEMLGKVNTIDTLELARFLNPGVPNALGAVAQRYGVGYDADLAHEAGYDVGVNSKVYDALMAESVKRLAQDAKISEARAADMLNMAKTTRDIIAVLTDAKTKASANISPGMRQALERAEILEMNRYANNRTTEAGKANTLSGELETRLKNSSLTQERLVDLRKTADEALQNPERQAKVIEQLNQNAEKLSKTKELLANDQKADQGMVALVDRAIRDTQTAINVFKPAMEFYTKLSQVGTATRDDRIRSIATDLNSLLPNSDISSIQKLRAGLIERLTQSTGAVVTEDAKFGIFQKIANASKTLATEIKAELNLTGTVTENTRRKLEDFKQFVAAAYGPMAEALGRNLEYVEQKGDSLGKSTKESANRMRGALSQISSLIKQSDRLVNGGGGGGGGGRGIGGGGGGTGGGGGLPPTPPDADGSGGGALPPSADAIIRSYYELRSAIREVNKEIGTAMPTADHIGRLNSFRDAYSEAIGKFRDGWVEYRRAFGDAADSRVERSFTSALGTLDKAETQLESINKTITSMGSRQPQQASMFNIIGADQFRQINSGLRDVSSTAKLVMAQVRTEFASTKQSIDSYESSLSKLKDVSSVVADSIELQKTKLKEIQNIAKDRSEGGIGVLDDKYKDQIDRVNQSIVTQQNLLLSLQTEIAKTEQRKASFLEAQKNNSRAFLEQARSMSRVIDSLDTLQAVLYATGFVTIVTAVTQTSIAMDRMEAALRATFPTIQGANREMEYLKTTADQLGVSYGDLVQPYARLAAAAQAMGYSQDQLRSIFESTIVASQALGMDSENTRGIIRAFEQMMNKGKVMAEELRQQLGDRLPGVANTFARAFFIARGEIDETTRITTERMQQFEEAMKAGEVTASQVLPVVARLMRTDMADAAALMSNKILAEFNRLKNTFTVFSQDLFKIGLESGFKRIIDTLESVMNGGPIRELINDFVKGFDKFAGVIERNVELVSRLVLAFGALLAMSGVAALLTGVAMALRGGTIAAVLLSGILAGIPEYFMGISTSADKASASIMTMKAALDPNTGSASISGAANRPLNEMEIRLNRLEDRRKQLERSEASLNNQVNNATPSFNENMRGTRNALRAEIPRRQLDQVRQELMQLREEMSRVTDEINNAGTVYQRVTDPANQFKLQSEGAAIALAGLAVVMTTQAAGATMISLAAAKAAAGIGLLGRAAMFLAGVPVVGWIAAAGTAFAAWYILTKDRTTQVQKDLDAATGRIDALRQANERLLQGNYTSMNMTNAINDINKQLQDSAKAADTARQAVNQYLGTTTRVESGGVSGVLGGTVDTGRNLRDEMTRALRGTDVSMDQMLNAAARRQQILSEIRAKHGESAASSLSLVNQTNLDNRQIGGMVRRTGVPEARIRELMPQMQEYFVLLERLKNAENSRANPDAYSDMALLLLRNRDIILDVAQAQATLNKETQNGVEAETKKAALVEQQRRNNLRDSRISAIKEARRFNIVDQTESRDLIAQVNAERDAGTTSQQLADRTGALAKQAADAANVVNFDYRDAIENANKETRKFATEGLDELSRKLYELSEIRRSLGLDFRIIGDQVQLGLLDSARRAVEYARGALITADQNQNDLVNQSGSQEDITRATQDREDAQKKLNDLIKREGELRIISFLIENQRAEYIKNETLALEERARTSQQASRRSVETSITSLTGDPAQILNLADKNAASEAGMKAFKDVIGNRNVDSESPGSQDTLEAATKAMIEAEKASNLERYSRRMQPYVTALSNADQEIRDTERLASAYRLGTEAVDQMNAQLDAEKLLRQNGIRDNGELAKALAGVTSAKQKDLEVSRAIDDVRKRTTIAAVPEGIDRDVAQFAQQRGLSVMNRGIGKYRDDLTTQRTQELETQNIALASNVRLEERKAEALLQGAPVVRQVESLEKLMAEARKMAGEAAAQHILQNDGITSSLRGVAGMTGRAFSALSDLQSLLSSFSGAKFTSEVNGVIRNGLSALATAGTAGPASALLAQSRAGLTARPVTDAERSQLQQQSRLEEARKEFEKALSTSKGKGGASQEKAFRWQADRFLRITRKDLSNEQIIAEVNASTQQIRDGAIRNATGATDGAANSFNNMIARLQRTVTGWTNSTQAAEEYYESVLVGGENLSESQRKQIVNLELMANAIRRIDRRDSALESASRAAGLTGVDEDLKSLSAFIDEINRYRQAVNDLGSGLARLEASGQGGGVQAAALRTQIGVRQARLDAANSGFDSMSNNPNNPRNRRMRELNNRVETSQISNESDLLRTFGFDREAERINALSGIRRDRTQNNNERDERVGSINNFINDGTRRVNQFSAENEARRTQLTGLEDTNRGSGSEAERLRSEISSTDEAIIRHNELLDGARTQVGELEIAYDQLGQALNMKESFVNLSTEIGLAGEAMSGFARITSRHFAELLTTGKGSFKEMARSFITDFLAKVIEEIIIKKVFMMGFKLILESMGMTFGDGGVFSGGAPMAGGEKKYAMGGVFSGGRVTPYATGGLVTQPTLFPMRNGYGLMGEAGPEAIMPLRRLPNGRLGVEAMSDTFRGSPMESPIGSQLTTSSLMINAGTVVLDGRSMLQDWMGNTPQEIASSSRGTPSAMMESQGGPAITVNVTVNVAGSSGTSEQNADLGNQVAKAVADQFRAMYADETRRQMRSGGMFNQ